MENMNAKKGKRMGGLGKLSDFSQTSQPVKSKSESFAEPPTSQKVEQQQQQVDAKSVPDPELGDEGTEKPLVNINIKITRTQQSWLSETARKVRDNNNTPVPPSERVFPQHLIGAAIDLLQDTEIDWSQVKNTNDLRQQLNL
jgi:hypothetical protein